MFHAIAQRGICGPNWRHMTGQAFSLQEQIYHKVAYVQQHMSAQPSAPIAIIGHSIGNERSCTLPLGQHSDSGYQFSVFAGAYMALKVTKHLQAVPSDTPQVAKVCKTYTYDINFQGNSQG